MKSSEETKATNPPLGTTAGSISQPDPSAIRQKRHKILAVSLATVLVVALGVFIYHEWKIQEEQSLMNQYQATVLQASQAAAQAFFAAHSSTTSASSAATATKNAANFFKAHPVTATTGAQQQADYQQFQASEAAGFQAWKAAQSGK